MVRNPIERLHLSRRDILVLLGAAGVLLQPGCALIRTRSELDSAFYDLDAYLQEVPGADKQQLLRISGNLRETAMRLIGIHKKFVHAFNEKAIQRSVPESALEKLYLDYDLRRQTTRNELLKVQDELLAALPPESWPEVLEILNRKTRAVAAGNRNAG